MSISKQFFPQPILALLLHEASSWRMLLTVGGWNRDQLWIWWACVCMRVYLCVCASCRLPKKKKLEHKTLEEISIYNHNMYIYIYYWRPGKNDFLTAIRPKQVCLCWLWRRAKVTSRDIYLYHLAAACQWNWPSLLAWQAWKTPCIRMIWCFHKWEYPQITYFKGIFPKPSSYEGTFMEATISHHPVMELASPNAPVPTLPRYHLIAAFWPMPRRW